jgi:hypothetical protein
LFNDTKVNVWYRQVHENIWDLRFYGDENDNYGWLVVMPHSVVEFNSEVGAAGCSEMLGKFLPDDTAVCTCIVIL